MQWKGRRESDQVDDARGQTVTGGGGSGAAGTILTLIGRRFGIKGILIAIVVAFVAWKLGIIDPQMLLEGGAPTTTSQPVDATPEEQERFDFVKVVLADTEDCWTSEFARQGMRYELPSMTIYRGRVNTGCGMGSAEMGPFYCPNDAKVYIDLSFYDQLAQTFRSPGDFAQAYVIAHEVGHHVQKLLGATAKVAAKRGTPQENEFSVRLELQADFYAGVWAAHSQKYLDPGDIEEAMRAANAIGDDAIQKQTRGRVMPHAFTHGTSEQRMRWFMAGLRSGRMEDGDTFSMPYRDL
jgi:predicted metalloprotease